MKRIYIMIKLGLLIFFMGMSALGMAQEDDCYAYGTNLSYCKSGGTKTSTIDGFCDKGSPLNVTLGQHPEWAVVRPNGSYEYIVTALPNPGGLPRSGDVYLLRDNRQIGLFTISQASETLATPPSPAIAKFCGYTRLTRTEPPPGVTFYWQDTDSGESTANSGKFVDKGSSGTHYIRPKYKLYDCWGPTRTINYSVDQPMTWYADSDGDTFGDPDNFVQDCKGPRDDFADNGNDFDDANGLITDIAPRTFYHDNDRDGFGDPQDTLYQSEQPDGFVQNNDDCDDNVFSEENYCIPPQSSDPSDHNYIYTRTYQNSADEMGISTTTQIPFFSENDALIQQITYFDGLGRPMQQIGIDQSIDAEGEKKDIVTHIGYDDYGRQHRDWLPITDGSGTFGGYKPQDMEAATRAYYKNHENYGTDFSNMDEAYVNAYSEKYFEPSPLNRVLKQAAPGDAWALAKDANGNILPDADDHSVGFAYSANSHDPLDATNTAKDNVRLFKAITAFADNTYMPTLVYGDYGTGDPVGYYAQNELYKNITKDENHTGDTKNHTTEEFTDKQGRVVLKRTYGPFDVDKSGIIDTEESELPFDTYYVYDNYGNLTYVLPPKMEASTATLAAINTNMAELGYQYIYDHRNRLVEKRIPGKEWEYIIYSKLDQPIMTQDANQRAKEANSDEWLFTKYDAFGRVAYTGKARAPEGTSREEVQSDVDSFADPLWVEPLASGRSFGATTRVFYNNGAYPNNDAEDPSLVALNELLTINYYDNYDFLDSETGLGLPAKVFDKKIENHNNSEKIKTRGLATGSKVKVLTTNQWITTVTGYDAKGRAIFGLSKNPYLGTLDRSETLLDFVGKPLKTKTTHIKDNKTITTIDNFTYDHVGRLLSQTQCIGDETMGGACPNTGDLVDKLLWDGLGPIDSDKEATNSITIKNAVIRPGADGSATTLRITNGSAQELIVFNTYDALGQLAKKKVGGVPGSEYNNTTGLQEVAYKYNVRGWLTQINDPGNTDKLFNFGLSYNDPQNGAQPLYNGNISQTQWKTANVDNSLRHYSYSYDAINRVTAGIDDTADQRYSLTNIEYDKNGNIQKLKRNGHTNIGATAFGVMDDLTYSYTGNQLQSVTDIAESTGFLDDNTTSTDYVYDSNGNLTSDANKGITGITYNHLSLPTRVEATGSNSGYIDYVYDATGRKLKKTASSGTQTEYAGRYVYEGGSLQFFSHPEGYVSVQNGNYSYVYQYKDHLGSVRLSYTDADGNGSIDPANEIIEENNYYPFGLKQKGNNGMVSANTNSTAEKFKYQGKEYEEELNKNTYAFGWRDYDPALARFSKIDRFAEKYHTVTPYHFSKNNPIFYREINGDSVQGVSRRSARRAKRIIRKTFRNNKRLARLFKTKGKNFKHINERDYHQATKNSSDDEKALARGYVKAINSKTDVHSVEVVKRGEKLSSFSNGKLDENGDPILTGANLDNSMGGFNEATNNGSHTAIVLNGKKPLADLRDNSTGDYTSGTPFRAGASLAHELIGHGLSRSMDPYGDTGLNAIQVGNMYRRHVSGGSTRFYRDGTFHDLGYEIPYRLTGQVPHYLKPFIIN